MAYPSVIRTGGVIMNTVNVNANTRSDIVNIERAKTVGLDVFCNNDSSVTGTITIEVCNDLNRTSPNWVPVVLSTGASSVSVASADVNDFYNLQNLGAKYLSVNYTATSGYGTMTVVAHVKQD